MHLYQPLPTADPAEAATTEIATLFAKAILRTKSRHRLPSETSPQLSESTSTCLEFPATKRLSVPNG